jgi:ABC-type multidrug transport system fused ATPase/permease subunit
MSEEFEVRAAHDDVIDNATEHGGKDPFIGRIAVTTALLATIGSLFSYQGGATQANATLFKNNAAIKKTEAANQWNYYQAKSSKQNLAELAAMLVTPDQQDRFKADIARYTQEKVSIEKEAQKYEAESREWDERSAHVLHVHHRWAQAATFLQVAIALSAIALLTRKTWLQWGVYVIAVLGISWGVSAFALL